MSFVHLHLHTEYSLLDGAIRIEELTKKALEYGYEAVAITDHGYMFGVIYFYKSMKKAGIKPIIGCEVYVSPTTIQDKSAKSAKDAGFHLVLLAMDQKGYKNLTKLVTIANIHGFHYKPRVDLDLLKEYNDGLIALSACLKGQIPHTILNYDYKDVRDITEKYLKIFGDRFYLEVQENNLPEQKTVNNAIFILSKELGIPVVATNDCHYLNKEDYNAHDVLLCIQTNKTINEEGRLKFNTQDLYFTSIDEMYDRFHYNHDVLKRTMEIANRCNLELELNKPKFPLFPVPEGETYESLFKKQVLNGFQERLKNGDIDIERQDEYKKRLEKEIEVIEKMRFPSYFLIVADFINWARSQGIPVGPGRGSAAGSLVAYALKITDIDPVKYGLFFERFLNEERITLPDIDVDFCAENRDRVIEYVRNKYGGEEFVSQIITFGQLKARLVVRDVGRALDIPLKEVDKLAKLIPDDLNITLEKAIEEEPRLKELIDSNPKYKELYEIATKLQGLPRHHSTHAAGVVIADKPLTEYLPLTIDQDGKTITQFDMKCLEDIGLIKFDFLGVKNLTIIDTTLKFIKRNHKKDIDIKKIPLDEPKVYEMLSRGDTTGVFQLESAGMRNLLRRLKPTDFNDLIAILALYRPGPLGSGLDEQYIKVKHGLAKPDYILPQLEPILKETYGVILYQEQVMQIAMVLAGYTLGEGDILRRAMGKKKADEMAAQRSRFINGAIERGIPKDKAEYIFDLMEKFAEYGFNKSHSAAYALISYQTAWLKAHYPLEFYAACLRCELGNQDKIIKHIQECRDNNIPVLPIDINKSEEDFSIEENAIRIGFIAIKNVGDSAINAILQERTLNGPYKNFQDFVDRVDTRKVNKKIIESLIKAGAFDTLEPRRDFLYSQVEAALNLSQSKKKNSKKAQKTFFDSSELISNTDRNIASDYIRWTNFEKLRFEKDVLGFYFSGHPLQEFEDEIKTLGVIQSSEFDQIPDNNPVIVSGIAVDIKELKTRKGELMAQVSLEDLHGQIKVICFPDVYKKVNNKLLKDSVLLVDGILKREDNSFVVTANDLAPIEDAIKQKTECFIVELYESNDEYLFDKLKEFFVRNSGKFPVKLLLNLSDYKLVELKLPELYKLGYSENLKKEIKFIQKEAKIYPVIKTYLN